MTLEQVQMDLSASLTPNGFQDCCIQDGQSAMMKVNTGVLLRTPWLLRLPYVKETSPNSSGSRVVMNHPDEV